MAEHDPARRRYFLVTAGRTIALAGKRILGRNSSCHVTVDDALVSRQHAEIEVTEEGVILRDLDSANGTYVDGRRLSGAALLEGGETIRIGSFEFALHIGSSPPKPGMGAVTIEAMPAVELVELTDEVEETQITTAYLGLEWPRIEATVENGTPEEAALVAAPLLEMIRDQAAQDGELHAAVEERVSRIALALARRLRAGVWLDRLIAIYAALERPMPGPTVDEVYGVIQNVDRVDAKTLGAYVEALERIKQRLGPADRFVVNRIAGLIKIARR